jgi:hypothetical protein
MRTLFISQGLWDLVENGYSESTDAQVFSSWTKAQWYQLNGNIKKDAKALFIIQQAIHETIFPRISSTTKSKKAWDLLQNVFQGTNKVKTVKLQKFRKDFENIYIKDFGSMQDFFIRFLGLVYHIRSYGNKSENSIKNVENFSFKIWSYCNSYWRVKGW